MRGLEIEYGRMRKRFAISLALLIRDLLSILFINFACAGSASGPGLARQVVAARGKILSAIPLLYKTDSLKSCVRINNMLTGDIPIEYSISQGDPIFSTMFSLYVNDFVDMLNAANRGLKGQ